MEVYLYSSTHCNFWSSYTYFQYKVLNNVLYLNEKFFSFGIFETTHCSFCSQINKRIEHLFCHCFIAKALWNSLNTFFENHLSLYDLTPQAAFFGFIKKHLHDSISQNHLLVVFKIYLYKSRSYRFVHLKSLLLEIKKIV